MPVIENGNIVAGDVAPSDVITVQCNTGYKLTPTNPTVKCVTNTGTENVLNGYLPSCQG